MNPRPNHHSPAHGFWQRWSALVCARPWLVLALGLALAAGAIALTVQRLEFQPNRNDLISSDLDWNRRFIDWRATFPGARDLYLAIDQGEDGGLADEAIALAREIEQWLGRDDTLERIEWGAPEGEFSAKAARLLAIEQLREFLAPVARAEPILLASDLAGLLGRITGELMRQQAAMDGDLDEASAALTGLSQLLRAIDREASGHEQRAIERWLMSQASPSGLSLESWRPLTSPNGRFIIMRITPRSAGRALNELAPTVENIRRVIHMLGQAHPDVEVGLTGIEAIEADETAVATRDSAIASAIALGLIALIMVTAFHTVRTPVLLVASVLLGVCWSFGYLTLAIGHLQILSVVFVVILLGLGVDFGIHLASTFEIVRHEHPEEPFAEAMGEALAKIAPGVITGALTTAAAFFVTALTDFKGVAEMGLIAGGGVLLCLLAMLTIFPALKRLFSSSREHIRALDDRSLHLYEERWSMPFVRAPRRTAAIAAVLLTLGGISALRISFDYDLPALLPEGIPSVEWQERLTSEGGVSIWAATSITDSLDEARRRRDGFLELPSVARVEGVGLLFPDEERQKLALIGEARDTLSPEALEALESEVDVGGDAFSAQTLVGQLTLLTTGIDQALVRTDLPTRIRHPLEQTSVAIATLLNTLGPMTPSAAESALDRANASYRAARARIMRLQRQLLDPGGLAPEDLPPAFIRGSVSHDGARYALKVHPALPADGSVVSPLDPRFLGGFIDGLESVDPNVTGVVVQLRRSGALIRSSFLWAGVVALAIVFLMVLVVFRSIVDGLLALAPVAIAFVLTFGAMQMIGVSVNPANIIVLPLLFGIGVDAGVHIIHRYRESPEARPRGMTAGTGKGITVTSLTTIVGFAAMLLADHKGIFSLGLVLTIGITFTMLASWTVLPALLEFRRAREPSG